jgi:hypothetical protein
MHLRPSAHVDAVVNLTLAIYVRNKTSEETSKRHYMNVTVYPKKCTKQNAILFNNECRYKNIYTSPLLSVHCAIIMHFKLLCTLHYADMCLYLPTDA